MTINYYTYTGSVIYAANIRGSRGPRKMQVAIPEVDENDNIATFRASLPPPTSVLSRTNSITTFTRRLSFRSNLTATSTSTPRASAGGSTAGAGGGVGSSPRGDDIISRIKDKNFRDLSYFINKPPRWNEQVCVKCSV